MSIWEKQPYDTSASFDAFHRYYLSQDPPRSVEKAYRLAYADKHGLSPKEVQKKQASGTWKKWAWPKGKPEALTWQQRAQAFDDHLAALQREEWEQQHMSEAEALARIAEHARGSLAEFADVVTIADLKDHPKAHLIKKLITDVIQGSDGKITYRSRFELHDPQKALDMIGKHHKLFTDKVEIVDETLSDEERINRISTILKEAKDRADT